jgi:hypothetical protein
LPRAQVISEDTFFLKRVDVCGQLNARGGMMVTSDERVIHASFIAAPSAFGTADAVALGLPRAGRFGHICTRTGAGR